LRHTVSVGSFNSNAFGLYDMHGNVCEWCEDDWHDSYHGAPVDGSAWVDSPRGDQRMLRGGAYADAARFCRSAFRKYRTPGDWGGNIGFRIVLPSSQD